MLLLTTMLQYRRALLVHASAAPCHFAVYVGDLMEFHTKIHLQLLLAIIRRTSKQAT